MDQQSDLEIFPLRTRFSCFHPFRWCLCVHFPPLKGWLPSVNHIADSSTKPINQSIQSTNQPTKHVPNVASAATSLVIHPSPPIKPPVDDRIRSIFNVCQYQRSLIRITCVVNVINTCQHVYWVVMIYIPK